MWIYDAQCRLKIRFKTFTFLVEAVGSPFDIHCVAAVFQESKVHSIYTVDPITMSSNYMKIRLKALIYFELQKTLN